MQLTVSTFQWSDFSFVAAAEDLPGHPRDYAPSAGQIDGDGQRWLVIYPTEDLAILHDASGQEALIRVASRDAHVLQDGGGRLVLGERGLEPTFTAAGEVVS